MKKTYYPRLDETLCKKVLPNGLTVMVVPKPGLGTTMTVRPLGRTFRQTVSSRRG